MANTRVTRSMTKALEATTVQSAAAANATAEASTATPPTTIATTDSLSPTSDPTTASSPHSSLYYEHIMNRLDRQDANIAEMQQLIQENAALRSSLETTQQQLESAQERIRQLEAQQAHPISTATPESVPTTTAATNSAPSYAALAKKSATQSSKPKGKAPTRKQLKPLNLDVNDAGLAAARQFTAVSSTHGYKFVYIPNRSRSPVSKMKADFFAMGIHTRRILDIHFPDRHVCGLLIHNDYLDAVTAQLTKYKLAPITFDPLAITNLRDPKYAEGNPDFLAAECKRIFLDRLMVIIGRIKDSNQQLAVARFFCFKQFIIPEAKYVELAKTIKPAYVPAYKRQPSTDNDLTMGEAADTNTTTMTPPSTTTTDRADEESAPVA